MNFKDSFSFNNVKRSYIIAIEVHIVFNLIISPSYFSIKRLLIFLQGSFNTLKKLGGIFLILQRILRKNGKITGLKIRSSGTDTCFGSLLIGDTFFQVK
jgi:hypothetical protein